jgi:hypothetical protein
MGTRGPQNHLFRLRALVCCTVAICAVATIKAHAATLTVTNTNNSGPGSLRQTIADANDGDKIVFSVTGVVGLTSGELLLDKNITISGPGRDNLAVDGNAMSRVFHVASGATVTISGLTIRNGIATGNFPSGSGGGIYSFQATLTLKDCAIDRNSATYGGGVTNDAFNDEKGGPWAILTISNSTLGGNSAAYGGGIFNTSGRFTGAVLTIDNSTFIGNSATNYGGAIDNNGYEVFGASVKLNNSTLSGSSSAYGGGIYNSANAGGYGSLQVNNSTLVANLATYGGGGVFNVSFNGAEAFLQISNSTISNNSAQTGGGVDNESDNDSGALAQISKSTFSGNSASGFGGGTLFNSAQDIGSARVQLDDAILKAGAAGGNVLNDGGVVISHGHNLSSDNCGGFLTGTGDWANTDPMLGPLQNNGGPTLTHALLPGSPAIDAGDPNFTPPPSYDQRGPGFDRVVNGRIDIGSFEVQDSRPTPTPRPSPTPRPRPGPHLR